MTSKQIPFILLILVAAVVAAATFVEDRMGTDASHVLIYGAWWFVALWGVVVLASCWVMWKRQLWRRPSTLAIHLSFLVILAGALVTHLMGKNGTLHLRKGEAACQYWVKTDDCHYLTNEQMPFLLCLKDFRIVLDKDSVSPADYVSTVLYATHEGQEEGTISMNNIGRKQGYRIYQTSYDPDLEGSVFTVSHDPWGTGITYVGYILLAISMTWHSLRKKKVATEKESKLPAIVLGIIGTLLASYMIIAIAGRPLVPVLRSPFLAIHVGVICISYVLLIMSIVRRSLLRPAVFMLAAGIFLGAVWANVSWGTYWSWDPKESWALVTLLIYSIPLHTESLPWFRDIRHYRWYSILALASLLMTYFGVNFLMGGMHSYING